MLPKNKDLLKNSEFTDFLFSKLNITNPIPAKRLVGIYQIRYKNMLKKGNEHRAKQFLELIQVTKSTLDLERDFIIGVSFKLDSPYVFYFNEDFSKMLGKIHDEDVPRYR